MANGALQNKDISQINDKVLSPLEEALDRIKKDTEDVTKNLSKLNTELKKVQKTSDGKELKELSAQTKAVALETKKLESAKKLETQAFIAAQKIEREAVKTKVANKRADEQLLKLSERKEKQLKKEIEAQKDLNGARNKARENNKQLRKELDRLADVTSKKGRKAVRAINKEIDKNNKLLEESSDAYTKTKIGIGRYSKGVTSAIGKVTGFIAVLTGLAASLRGYVVINEEVNKGTTRLINSLGLTSEIAKETAKEIRVISKTFDQDYNEVVSTAITVSKELGISADKATDLIESGFKKGSNNTGEFLEILKEYPTQFKSAGISANDMFAIINRTVKEGIYSDKGVDAIKEGGLRLRENTKAVQEALAPLSKSVRLQIQQEVAAGNSFKAIQLVSKELKNTSLTAEQTQKIIADVFGGAGEDAGRRYLELLSDIDTEMGNVADQTTSIEKLSIAWNTLVTNVVTGEGAFGKAFDRAILGAAKLVSELDKLNNAGKIEREKLIDEEQLKLTFAALNSEKDILEQRKDGAKALENLLEKQKESNEASKETIELAKGFLGEEVYSKGTEDLEVLIEAQRRFNDTLNEETKEETAKRVAEELKLEQEKQAELLRLERIAIDEKLGINNDYRAKEIAAITAINDKELDIRKDTTDAKNDILKQYLDSSIDTEQEITDEILKELNIRQDAINKAIEKSTDEREAAQLRSANRMVDIIANFASLTGQLVNDVVSNTDETLKESRLRFIKGLVQQVSAVATSAVLEMTINAIKAGASQNYAKAATLGAGIIAIQALEGGVSARIDNQLADIQSEREESENALNFADGSGGAVVGAGTGRSDSVAANLSNGEAVINAPGMAASTELVGMINNGGVTDKALGLDGIQSNVAVLNDIREGINRISWQRRDENGRLNDESVGKGTFNTFWPNK